MLIRPSINEVSKALKQLAKIPRPDRDNKGDPINGDTVLPFLSNEDQARIIDIGETLYRYVRTIDGKVNRRSVNTLNKRGFSANLGASQYGEERLVGRVTSGDRSIDISDPHSRTVEDDD